MTPDRYLELLATDGRRLSAVARDADLAASIPSCPGWTVGDCVTHTAGVYRHKIDCLRLGHPPDGDEDRAVPPGIDPVDWYDASLEALLGELRAREPGSPAYTWWPADLTAGFWFRRMAQETAVHRLDVEDGAGTPTPIDPELAVDGIDEVLERFLGDTWSADDDWAGVDPRAGEGGTVAVRSADRVWRATLFPDRIPIELGDGPAEAAVAGEPESVLLWLWGRRPDAVALDGAMPLLRAFRARLRLATQ